MILIAVLLPFLLLLNQHAKQITFSLLPFTLQLAGIEGCGNFFALELIWEIFVWIDTLLKIVFHLFKDCSDARPTHRQLFWVDQINWIKLFHSFLEDHASLQRKQFYLIDWIWKIAEGFSGLSVFVTRLLIFVPWTSNLPLSTTHGTLSSCSKWISTTSFYSVHAIWIPAFPDYIWHRWPSRCGNHLVFLRLALQSLDDPLLFLLNYVGLIINRFTSTIMVRTKIGEGHQLYLIRHVRLSNLVTGKLFVIRSPLSTTSFPSLNLDIAKTSIIMLARKVCSSENLLTWIGLHVTKGYLVFLNIFRTFSSKWSLLQEWDVSRRLITLLWQNLVRL